MAPRVEDSTPANDSFSEGRGPEGATPSEFGAARSGRESAPTGRLTPEQIEALGDRIGALAFEHAQKEAELIEVIGAFDRAEGWGRQGALSCAHWLTWRIGLSPITAREKVRVARALPDLPLVAARFRDGTLSYSKVRALTRVAERATEALLIDIADATTASQLERVCGRHQAALSAAAAADNPVARAHRRHLRAQSTERVGTAPPGEGSCVLGRPAADRGYSP